MLNPDVELKVMLLLYVSIVIILELQCMAATRVRDKFHISKYLNKSKLRDVTDEYCVMGVFGPKSRMLMQVISKDNFSMKALSFRLVNILKLKIF